MLQLHQRFIQSAKRFSERVAVYDKTTEAEYSYSKMLIASLILKRHIGKIKGKFVGILLPTSAGAMLTILGTLMEGKVPVMINYATGAIYNCKYAQDRCQFRTIITSKKLLEKLNLETLPDMIFVEDILAKVSLIAKLEAALIAKLPFVLLKHMVHSGPPSEISAILFTSGSEKEPKAVQLSHRNILHNVDAFPTMIDLNENDVFASILPLFHVFGLTVTFWLPSLIGASMIAYSNPLEYGTVCELIRDHEVTFIAATPAFFYGYLKRSKPSDFASVKIAIAGADKLSERIYEGYLQKHNLTVLEGYGTTETSPVITTCYPGQHKPGSIGKPIPNTQVKIVDIDTGEELGPNQRGKILVKGDLVMEGYLHDLEETSMRIRNGWYDTGDMGIYDEDGYFYHRGRLKRFAKIGGEMISMVQVEEVLSRLLPEGVNCCVVDIPHPTKGSDIVAAVATRDFDKHKTLKRLKKELPAIAVPKKFHIIEDIPMMASGKVNFREVQKLIQDSITRKK